MTHILAAVLAWLIAAGCFVLDERLYSFGGVSAQLAFAPVLFASVILALLCTLDWGGFAVTGSWRVDLPWTRPPLSLNDRLHWAKKNRIKQAIGNDVRWCALAAKLPRGLERVEITLHWQPAVRRRRDDDNPTDTLKVARDSLIAYGLCVDDDSEHVTSACVIEPVRKPGRVWLVITDRSAA